MSVKKQHYSLLAVIISPAKIRKNGENAKKIQEKIVIC